MKSTHRQQARGKRRLVTTHGLLDTLFARTDAPMPEEKRRHQLTRMYGGLHALETAPAPTPDDWRATISKFLCSPSCVTRNVVLKYTHRQRNRRAP